MKSQKRDRLKRNPLVRFIRGVFRLFRVIIKPKNRNLRSLQYEQSDLNLDRVESQRRSMPETQQSLELEKQLDLDCDLQEHFITVGELFEQIKWQIPAETTIQTNISDLSTKSQSYDVSRN